MSDQKIAIIGAGMAGLLAGAMLRDDVRYIAEAQPGLPNNHSALLRFRSSIVGDVLGVSFKKVNVVKAVLSAYDNPIADMLQYSLKTNGTATLRSLVDARGEVNERYIAPTDLIDRMARKVSAPFNFMTQFRVAPELIEGDRRSPFPIISTIPMPALMNALGWLYPEDLFNSVQGYNITADLSDTDVYATLYIPDMLRAENRISITGNKLIIEVALPRLSRRDAMAAFEAARNDQRRINETIEIALRSFGLLTVGGQCVTFSNATASFQNYAKIVPIDESVRRNFIMWATEKFNIYSLGRFATWKPGLLLDDIVGDVNVIRRLIETPTNRYHHIKKG